MSGKSPAVQFYTADFLIGADDMDMAQRGAYITLLCKQHQNGHLPEAVMLRICGGYDEMVFSKFVIDGNGYYYNKRMEVEVNKRAEHCKKQAENVNKRWNGNGGSNTLVIPQYENGNTNKKGNTVVLPLEDENEKEKEDVNNSFSLGVDVGVDVKGVDVGDTARVTDGGDAEPEAAVGVKSPLNKSQQERFGRFWEAYPVKKGKGGAAKLWKRINPDDALLKTMLTAIDTARKHDRQWLDGYIPNPLTWLNQMRWEDVIDEKQERRATYANQKPIGRTVYEYEENVADKYS